MQIKRKARTISVSKKTISRPYTQLSHASDQLVDVDNLSVILGKEIVIDSVSFCIHKAEFIGLIGPNGAGKTTLLRAILGLGPYESGKFFKKTDDISYIPQRGAVHNSQIPISVFEVVKLGSKGDISSTEQSLKEVKMAEFANKRFNELSGGQQQRVLIAKALASKPRILILDEPTTGIDEESQNNFYRLLEKLRKKGITIVMVSHDVDTVLKMVTRVICLNRTILYDGTPDHFEADRYLPKLYGRQHRLLHHRHEENHA